MFCREDSKTFQRCQREESTHKKICVDSTLPKRRFRAVAPFSLRYAEYDMLPIVVLRYDSSNNNAIWWYRNGASVIGRSETILYFAYRRPAAKLYFCGRLILTFVWN